MRKIKEIMLIPVLLMIIRIVILVRNSDQHLSFGPGVMGKGQKGFCFRV